MFLKLFNTGLQNFVVFGENLNSNVPFMPKGDNLKVACQCIASIIDMTYFIWGSYNCQAWYISKGPAMPIYENLAFIDLALECLNVLVIATTEYPTQIF